MMSNKQNSFEYFEQQSKSLHPIVVGLCSLPITWESFSDWYFGLYKKYEGVRGILFSNIFAQWTNIVYLFYTFKVCF